MSSADVRAGRAFVELFVKGAQFEAGLRKMSKQMKSFGDATKEIGLKIAAVGGAAVAGFGVALKTFADAGDELNKMSQRTGVSVKALSELKYAASQSGTSIEDVEKSLKKMATVLYDAGNGSKSAEQTLSDLGLSLDQLSGLSPDEQFNKIAEALTAVDDASTKAALAQKIFGKSGTQLLPLFSEGAKGLAALRDEAEKLGVTMSQDDAQAATDLGDAFDRVKAAASGVAIAVGSALAPVVTELSNKIAFAVGVVSQWIRENQSLVIDLAKASLIVTAVGGAIAAFGIAVTGAGVVLGGLATAIGAVVTVAAALLSPIGLAVTGITALGAAFVYASGIVPQLITALEPLMGAIKAIGAAVAEGDFRKAWDIAVAAVKFFASVALDAFMQLPKFAAFAAGRITSYLIDAFQKAWEWIVTSAGKVFSGLVDAASSIGSELLDALFTGDLGPVMTKLQASIAKTLGDVKAGFTAGLGGGEAPEFQLSERTKLLLGDLKERSKIRALSGDNTPVGSVSDTPISAKKAPETPTKLADDAKKAAGGRVFVSFSADALAAQGGGGGDSVPRKLDAQLNEARKLNKLMEKVIGKFGKGLAFG